MKAFLLLTKSGKRNEVVVRGLLKDLHWLTL